MHTQHSGKIMAPRMDMDETPSMLLGEIKARLATIEQQQVSERITNDQYRSDMRLVIQAQSLTIQDLSGKIVALQNKIPPLEVLADDYREHRDIAKGAATAVLFFKSAIIFLAALAGAVATYFGMHGRGSV